MGILDILNGAGNQIPGDETPADAPQQQAPTSQNSAGSQQQTPYNNPTQSTQQPQQTAQPLQAPPNSDDPFNINAMMRARNGETTTPTEDPNANFARSLISSVMNQGGQSGNDTNAPQVQASAFAEAMNNMDFTQGLDFDALETAISSGENVKETLQATLQASSTNAVLAIVPLINEMSKALQSSTLQQAMTQTSHAQRSDQIVSAFNSSYNYGDNPVVSTMLASFAKSLADKAPPSATPSDLANALHEMFSGMSGHITQTSQAPKPQSGITQDFSKMFG